MEKTVAIIGAGVSGLVTCKNVLEAGLKPVVFEADDGVGGIWASALPFTRLQSQRRSYEFSDYPWPPEADGDHPPCSEVMDYLLSYARHFKLLPWIRFGCRVTGIDYVGVPEEEMKAWEFWAGNGTAFGAGDGAKWHLTVESKPPSPSSEVICADFVVLCIGRYSGVPNMPTFSDGKGPDVFDGEVMHAMEFHGMGAARATELVRGKRVAVVGYLKSALDIATHCARTNGPGHPPCALVCRTKRWIMPNFGVWGVPMALLYLNRFSELLFHKPGEGAALGLLATVLSPFRRLISAAVERYYRWSTPIDKYGMVPEQSFFDGIAGCSLAVAPEGFYRMVEEGSILLKNASSFSFTDAGIVLHGSGERIDADVVIFATGYRGDQKLRDIFRSSFFSSIVAGSPETTVPLYREIVHPRIPQLAIIGYSESLVNLYTSEIRAKWLAHFLAGGLALPPISTMEKNVAEWTEFMKRYGKAAFRRSCIAVGHIWYNDQLCRDMGCDPRRKKGLIAEWFSPYGPGDYAGVRPRSLAN